MKPSQLFPSLINGMALFAMFFGAGNVTFPLIVGQVAGNQQGIAVVGLLITAVLMPVLGIITMALFHGDYWQFFYRVGKWPGFSLIIMSFSLLGPLLAIPRTIDVAFESMNYHLLSSPDWLFCLVACSLIFVLCLQENQIVDIIGAWLTPLLLVLLAVIIITALCTPLPTADAPFVGMYDAFFYGLKEGYSTLDLIAALFFSTIVISSVRQNTPNSSQRQQLAACIKAGLLGGGLLGLVYLGSAKASAMYSQLLDNDLASATLLTALADKIMGHAGGTCAAIVVALACLTTAISLVAISCDFLNQYVFKNTVPHRMTLVFVLAVSYVMSLVGFARLMMIIAPILLVCYPIFITLTLCNLFNKLLYVQTVRLPVAMATLLSLMTLTCC